VGIHGCRVLRGCLDGRTGRQRSVLDVVPGQDMHSEDATDDGQEQRNHAEPAKERRRQRT
jgi:hypothetical protein